MLSTTPIPGCTTPRPPRPPGSRPSTSSQRRCTRAAEPAEPSEPRSGRHSEALHILGRKGFTEDFPEAADHLSRIQISGELYNDLEDKVVNEFGEGKEAEAVAAWLEENPDVIPAPPEA
ncbi:glycine betaine ABC transporter substrate-binding protein [Brachybacterium sp. AOP42-C2-15]|uniref:glycine betaine ABC transporter substrate-binding protein n=1 Tax=Brachybacterium sp. AOP42-C2-15 TaxID=3457670 RepID=UPI00403370C1